MHIITNAKPTNKKGKLKIEYRYKRKMQRLIFINLESTISSFLIDSLFLVGELINLNLVLNVVGGIMSFYFRSTSKRILRNERRKNIYFDPTNISMSPIYSISHCVN